MDRFCNIPDNEEDRIQLWGTQQKKEDNGTNNVHQNVGSQSTNVTEADQDKPDIKSSISADKVDDSNHVVDHTLPMSSHGIASVHNPTVGLIPQKGQNEMLLDPPSSFTSPSYGSSHATYTSSSPNVLGTTANASSRSKAMSLSDVAGHPSVRPFPNVGSDDGEGQGQTIWRSHNNTEGDETHSAVDKYGDQFNRGYDAEEADPPVPVLCPVYIPFFNPRPKPNHNKNKKAMRYVILIYIHCMFVRYNIYNSLSFVT